MIGGIQIVGILFGLIMSYFTFLYYKRKEYGRRDYVFWMVVWIGFMVFILFPYSISGLMQPLGVRNMMELFTIIAFMTAFSIIFFQHDLMRKNDKRLRELIRELALGSAKRKEKPID